MEAERARRATYAARVCRAEIPFGDGPGQLPRRVDYIEVDGPEGLAVAADGSLWVRQSQSGAVHRVDPGRGGVSPVDLLAVSVQGWGGGGAFSLALAADRESVIVLAGRLADGGSGLQYAVFRFSPAGEIREAIPLPALRGRPDLPAAVGREPGGRLRAHFLDDCLFFAPDGAPLGALGAPGVGLPEGLVVSSASSPWLHDAEGKPIGSLRRRGPRRAWRFFRAGPGGLLFTFADEEALPSALGGRLQVLEVYSLNLETRVLWLEDRLFWPTTRLGGEEDQDVRPVASDFLIGSLTCDARGDLWLIEHAPPVARFHCFRLLEPDAPAAPAKRPEGADLTPEERALYSAAASATSGSDERGSAGAAAFFSGCRWFEERLDRPPGAPR